MTQLFVLPLVQSIAAFPLPSLFVGHICPPTFFQRLTGHSESLKMAQNGAGTRGNLKWGTIWGNSGG
jgi:hypothetical protein